LWAAGLASGLLACVTRALLWRPLEGLPLPTAAGFSTAAAALACAAVLGGDRRPLGWRRIPHAFVAAFTTWVTAGVLAAALVRAAGVGSQPAVVATLRTTVLAALAVALAELSRRRSIVEAAWLVYPVLALGGLKLVGEDIPAGRPLTLFVSFVVYGAALLAAPRARRTSPERSD
jgi:hypothetical protein